MKLIFKLAAVAVVVAGVAMLLRWESRRTEYNRLEAEYNRITVDSAGDVIPPEQMIRAGGLLKLMAELRGDAVQIDRRLVELEHTGTSR